MEFEIESTKLRQDSPFLKHEMQKIYEQNDRLFNVNSDEVKRKKKITQYQTYFYHIALATLLSSMAYMSFTSFSGDVNY